MLQCYNLGVNSQQLRDILLKNLPLEDTRPLVVGLSGGPDSMYLLHLCISSGFSVIAAHLDHALRASSKQEAYQVKEVCEKLGVRFLGRRIDTHQYSLDQGLSIEEGARIKRYEFLFETAVESDAQAVLVAHHADDQVETVLMHLLRGSGVSGLCGMDDFLLPNPWSTTIPLVRPLLGVWRSEIDEYCKQNEMNPLLDESNQDTRFFRNRIRMELIPALESYNPAVKDGLVKTISIIKQENDYLEIETDKAMRSVMLEMSDDYSVFDREGFISLHPAFQRRLLRKYVFSVKNTLRDIDFETIERACDFIKNPNPSNYLQLSSGMELLVYLRSAIILGNGCKSYDALWPQVTDLKPQTFAGSGQIQINPSWVLKYELSKKYVPQYSPFTAVIDMECVKGNLQLRIAKTGERFTPYGMEGKSIKLGDFWTNQGLPVKARKHWPLVCDDQQIIWVPGFRISDHHKITSETQSVLTLSITKNPVV